jgi:UDP-N-acetylglucosamine 2-epimerase
MRFSDLLFAPSEWAFKNLCKMGYSAKSVNVGANTGLDAVRYAVGKMGKQNVTRQPYAVVTIHRVETIYSRSRMRTIVAFIERMSQKLEVLFIIHEPTRHQLVKFDLLSRIKQLANVQVRPLLPYLEFINLLAGSTCVVTDGGSVQEECYYLNKPCMVMRSRTERSEGLGANAFVTEFDEHKIEHFLEYLPASVRRFSNENIHPSGIIIDHLLRISSNNA